jgi:hypothetical protein
VLVIFAWCCNAAEVRAEGAVHAAVDPGDDSEGYLYDPYEGIAPLADEPTDEPRDAEAPPNLDLALATHVPLSMGGQVTVELPARVLAQAGIGWMPSAYGSVISGVAEGVSGHDSQQVSAFMDRLLRDALVLRLSAGWRPFEEHGLELLAGYTLMSLGTDLTPGDIATISGGLLSASDAQQSIAGDVPISSQLHNLHFSVGWRWVAVDHLVLRASLGYMQTVAASTDADIPAGTQAKMGLNVNDTLDGIYTSMVKLPLVGASAGYRF